MPEDPRPRLTIDQRLEALAQTVEILAGMQREGQQRFDDVSRRLEAVSRSLETTLGSIKRIDGRWQ
jgi:hypothetical protein